MLAKTLSGERYPIRKVHRRSTSPSSKTAHRGLSAYWNSASAMRRLQVLDASGETSIHVTIPCRTSLLPQTNLIKNWLCKNTQSNGIANAINAAGNAGTVADAVNPAVALASAAAGGSRALASPQALSILGNIVSEGLSTPGAVGNVAAGVGIAVDVISGDFQSALYDTADAAVYGGLALVGAGGAVETLGGSAAAAGATMASYYAAGGSRGIVQGSLGCSN
jgi:hypothetical protein